MFTGLTYDAGIPWAQNLPSPEGVWELVEMIGEGTYGEVYKGRHLGTGDIAAVKVMDAVLDKEEDIKAELSVFEKHSSHPNIVTFFGSYLKRDNIADDRMWLVMEYCSNGTVTDLVKAMHEKGASLSEDLIAFILKEVLSGLSYLHSQHCMHRDVKGQNCMLTAQGHVKLVDFGISAELRFTLERRRSSIGTPYWMAPEVIACENQMDMDYDLRADIWSLGITSIEITDGFPPHYGEHPMKALLKITKNPPPTLRHPEKWSKTLNDFISRCLVKDFEKRPFANELFGHKLIQRVPQTTKQLRSRILTLVDAYHGRPVDILALLEADSESGKDTETKIRASKCVDDLAVLESIDEALYSRLFSWIVNRINQILEPGPAVKDTRLLKVGILDIFGFENFRSNSFEQLCINIVNEQLQFYFNQYIFAWEQEEYHSEGIDATMVSYTDNRALLELFLSRPMGLLDLIDEESRFPRATDQSLAEKLHDNINSPQYIPPKDRGLRFTIIHYAGAVTYETTGFLEKNRDNLHPDVMHLLKDSGNALVRQFFYASVSRTGGIAGPVEPQPSATPLFGRKAPEVPLPRGHVPSKTPLSSIGTHTIKRSQTISAYFLFSLRDLMSRMLKGNPHFIRCIKPNDVKSSEQFNRDKVRIQLKYTGVVETTRIRKEGFSHRITFEQFIKRYKVVSYPMASHVEPTPKNCIQIVMQAGLENWAIGRTKVFLKYCHVERLTQIMNSYHKAATQMEKMVRGFLARRKFRQLNLERREKAAIKLQAVMKGWIQRSRYMKELARRAEAASKIQTVVRGWLARREYSQVTAQRHAAAVFIQTACRGWLARCEYRRHKCQQQRREAAAAVIIQTGVRGWIAKRRYQECMQQQQKQKETASAIAIQTACRGWLARRAYQHHKCLQQCKEESAAVVIQTACRGWLARCEYRRHKRQQQRRQRAAAVIIQAAWRGTVERQRYQELKHIHQLQEHLLQQQQQKESAAASTIQRAVRCWLARTKVKRLRNERERRQIAGKKQKTIKEDDALLLLHQHAIVTAALAEHKERAASAKYHHNKEKKISGPHSPRRLASVPHQAGRNTSVPRQAGRNVSVSHQAGRNVSVPHQAGRNASVPHQAGRNVSVPHQAGRNVSVSHQAGRNTSVPHQAGRNVSVPHQAGRNASVPHQAGRNASVLHPADRLASTPWIVWQEERPLCHSSLKANPSSLQQQQNPPPHRGRGSANPLLHQHLLKQPLVEAELQVVVEPKPAAPSAQSTVFCEDKQEQVQSRTLFAKMFFERLAAEQSKQVEASPRRGKLFRRWRGGGESKPHPSPAHGGGVESGSNNTMPLHHFFSKFKSKHTVL